MRLLVTGAGGQLGRDLVDAFVGWDVVAASHRDCDVADRDAALSVIGALHPDAIVHAAAWTAVDACESDPDRAWGVNALGCRHIAEGARLTGAYLCALSTDYVFDGGASRPYVEWDPTGPLSVYGASKLGGEIETLAGAPGSSVVRTSWLCGRGGPNFVATMVRLARSGVDPKVVDDQHGCPTFTSDLASAIRDLVAARLPGRFHVTNQGATTWHQLARDTFAAAGEDPDRVYAISTAELTPARPATRPAYAVLDNAAWRLSGFPLLADHHEPLHRLVKELIA